MPLDKRESDPQATLDVWLVFGPTSPYTSSARSEARPLRTARPAPGPCAPRRQLQRPARGGQGSVWPLAAGSASPPRASPPQPRAVAGSLEAQGGPAGSPGRRDADRTAMGAVLSAVAEGTLEAASRGLSH